MILMTHLSKYGTFFCFMLLKIFFTFFLITVLLSFCFDRSLLCRDSFSGARLEKGQNSGHPGAWDKRGLCGRQSSNRVFYFLRRYADQHILSFSEPSLDRLEVTSRVLSWRRDSSSRSRSGGETCQNILKTTLSDTKRQSLPPKRYEHPVIFTTTDGLALPLPV